MEPRVPDIFVPVGVGLEDGPDGLTEDGPHHVQAGLVHCQLLLVNTAKVRQVRLVLGTVFQVLDHVLDDLQLEES